MKYKVNIKKTKEGYTIWVPGLPGCWSQGKTEEDALENIKDAIQAYLETVEDLSKDKESRYVEVGQNYAQSTWNKSSRTVKAFEKSGFWITREGKHITMTDGKRIVTIPRANPINAYTMAGIVKDAGLSIKDFKKLL